MINHFTVAVLLVTSFIAGACTQQSASEFMRGVGWTVYVGLVTGVIILPTVL